MNSYIHVYEYLGGANNKWNKFYLKNIDKSLKSHILHFLKYDIEVFDDLNPWTFNFGHYVFIQLLAHFQKLLGVEGLRTLIEFCDYHSDHSGFPNILNLMSELTGRGALENQNWFDTYYRSKDMDYKPKHLLSKLPLERFNINLNDYENLSDGIMDYCKAYFRLEENQEWQGIHVVDKNGVRVDYPWVSYHKKINKRKRWCNGINYTDEDYKNSVKINK